MIGVAQALSYVESVFGLDSLSMPLKGRAHWGLRFEMPSWDYWEENKRGGAHYRILNILNSVNSPSDEILLFAYFEGYMDEPDIDALRHFIKKESILSNIDCDVVEVRPTDFDEAAANSWWDTNFLCVVEGIARDFDLKEFLNKKVSLEFQVPEIEGEYFWINKTKGLIWVIPNDDTFEIGASERHLLDKLAKKYGDWLTER